MHALPCTVTTSVAVSFQHKVINIRAPPCTGAKHCSLFAAVGSHAGDGTEAGGLSAAATPPTKSRSPPAPQKAAAAAGQAVVVCNR
eukprot:1160379-Pelagomonas_calceolata.AAC.11